MSAGKKPYPVFVYEVNSSAKSMIYFCWCIKWCRTYDRYGSLENGKIPLTVLCDTAIHIAESS